ncbi:uncharacterized protein LOC130694642 [Daphnia carinata]|uniref:uncharacterized protein LOC130694642 n=1 Tax=Daphnia carinata TaxID=120202 RepID=UPI00257C508A|nr:uncharacterized protein LOC130694642 [Daphnia carinata]
MGETEQLAAREVMPQMMPQTCIIIQNRLPRNNSSNAHGDRYQPRQLNRRRNDEVRYPEGDRIYQVRNFDQQRNFRRDADFYHQPTRDGQEGHYPSNEDIDFYRQPKRGDQPRYEDIDFYQPSDQYEYYPRDAESGCYRKQARSWRCRGENCYPDCEHAYERKTQCPSFRRDEYDQPWTCCHPARRRPTGCRLDETGGFIREVCHEFAERRLHPSPCRQGSVESRFCGYEYDDCDQTEVVQGGNCHEAIRYRCDHFQDPFPPAPTLHQSVITKEIVHHSNCDCKNGRQGARRTERRIPQAPQEPVQSTKSANGKPGSKISIPTGDHHRTASPTVGNPEEIRKDHSGNAPNDSANSYPSPGDKRSKPANENRTGIEGRHEIGDDPSVTAGYPPVQNQHINHPIPVEDPDPQILEPSKVPDEETEVAHDGPKDEASPMDEISRNDEDIKSEKKTDKAKKSMKKKIEDFKNAVKQKADAANEKVKHFLRKKSYPKDEASPTVKTSPTTSSTDENIQAEEKTDKAKKGMKKKMEGLTNTVKQKAQTTNEKMKHLAKLLKKSYPKINNPFKKKKKTKSFVGPVRILVANKMLWSRSYHHRRSEPHWNRCWLR